MNKNNTKQELQKKYPYLKIRRGSLEPYSMFGLETPVGWDNLLKDLFDEWNNICDKYGVPREDIYIMQIKEKFAELRVYYSVLSGTREFYKEIEDALSKAIEKSLVTCMRCGKPGTERGDYWISVYCDDCQAKNDKKTEE